MVMLGDGADILWGVGGLAGGDGAWPELAGGSSRERRMSWSRRRPSLVMVREAISANVE